MQSIEKFTFFIFSSALSDEENIRIFGKCNHINGHGHNYKGETHRVASSLNEMLYSDFLNNIIKALF